MTPPKNVLVAGSVECPLRFDVAILVVLRSFSTTILKPRSAFWAITFVLATTLFLPGLQIASAQSWQAGFDFRATQGFVTDPAGDYAVLGKTTLYPTTGNGVTYGWASAYGYQQLSSYDLNAAVDPRLAGANGMVNDVPPAVFKVDLPAPGTYNVSLAVGLSDDFPACNSSPCQVEFRDGSTSLFVLTIPTAISPLGAFVDANGQTWSAAAWPTSNTTRQITLTGTQLTVLLGNGGTSTSASYLSFLGLTQQTSSTPNFTVSASPTAVSVVTGSSGSSTITATASGGFNSAISLSASGAPSGVTVSFNPTSISGGAGSSTMTMAVGSSVATGSYPLTVTASGGGITHTATVNLTVSAASGFTVSASPTAVSVATGSSGSSTITATASGGFNSAISLSASGAPSGVTVSFNPTSISGGAGSSTMTMAVGSSVATGSYPLTVTASGGGITHTATVNLTVSAASGFTVSASPTAVSVATGSSGSSTITATASGGFNSAISLSASGAPSGVTVSFNPTSISGGAGSSTMTMAVGSSVATGSYPLTVTASGGGITHTATVNLTVSAASGFTVSASPTAVSVATGSSGSSTITATASGGFNSAISLSASGAPSGVTVSFNPTSISGGAGSSTMTMAVGSSVATGSYPLTVTASGGGITHTATVNLTVSAASGFTVSASPTAVSVATGSSGSSTITATASGGFNSAISLSASGAPSGVTVSFNPTSISGGAGSSTMTMAVGSSVATGSYPLTVTASGGGITHTTTVNLTVSSSLQGWQAGFDFRATQGFVTDPAGDYAVLGKTTLYPTTGNGVTYGWASAYGYQQLSSYDLNAAVDPRLAGANGMVNDVPPAVFKVDLPAPGTYNVSLAVGLSDDFPACNSSPCQVEFRDGSTSLFVLTIPTAISPLGAFVDANGQTWSAAAWPTSNTTRQITLTGTQLTVLLGNGGTSTSASYLSFLGLTQQTSSTPNFTVSASPTAVSVVTGSSGSSTITATASGGFNSAISLSASGAPSGVTVSFNPTSISGGAGSSTMTMAVGSSVATGSYPLTVTASGGGITHTATVNLTVSAASGFTVSASPTAVSVATGSSGSSTITATASGGFNSAISLSASGAPSGVTVSFNPTSISGGAGSSTMTMAVGSSVATGSYPLTVTASGGGITHTATVNLTVSAASGFTVSASPTAVSVATGSSGSSTITATASGGFNSAISLSASGAPSGVTVSFNPTSISGGAGSSTMTMAVGSSVATGSYPLTVTASGGGITHTTTVNLTVSSSLQGWQAGFDFRATQGFVTDPAGDYAVLGKTTLYPTTGNGVTYGWASAYGYQQLSSYDLNAAVDPRLAGANGMVNDVPPAVFKVDLPAPGTYNVSLAVGLSDDFPACNSSPCQVEFRDGSTSLFVLTIPTAISPLGAFVDANGQTWSAAAWPTSNTTRQITLTGTQLTVLLGNGGTSTSASYLSFLGLTQQTSSTPNFTVSASPTAVSVVTGSSGSSTITATASGGFNSAISLSASGAPSGVTVSFNPTSISGGAGSSTMTMAVGSSVATGSYPLTVTASGGGITHTATVNLTVSAASGFTVSASPTAVSVATGSSGSSTITATASGGFNSAISLSASGAPSGVTVSFNPTSISGGAGSSTMTMTVGSSVATGSNPITVTASGGGITHTTTVNLTVTSPSLTISPHVATLTVGRQQQFTANMSASWSVDGIAGGNTTVGTISSSGLYTAPTTSGSHTVTATGSGMTDTAQVYVSNYAGVFSYHNDNARTGQNTQETVLTPANVNSTQFGKLFSVSLDGYVYAQPLYVSNLNFSGTMHNVVYVATEHDSLYAIDADDGTVLWQLNLIPNGASAGVPSDVACPYAFQEIGITGTPVIDPASGTIYLVTTTKENGAYVQRLHAIDIINRTEKFGGPVAIQASVAGTGTGSSGGVVSFNPRWENQRPGLLLQNGQVSIGWAGYCDAGPYHGWVIAYNATNLTQQVGVFNDSANGQQGGIWMSGGGLAGDANFNTYFATGNGDYDGNTEFGDSIVKLQPPSNDSFSVGSWFTPWDQATMAANDGDLGSGGVLLLPDLPPTSPHQHLLVEAGKEGTIYLLDRDNMGKYCPPTCSSSDPQIVQELQKVLGNPLLATPAYFNGNLYFAPSSMPVLAFSFNSGGNGLLSTSPVATSKADVSGVGASLVVSVNGNTNAIVWTLDTSSFVAYGGGCCEVLHAYDAISLAELYNSSQAPNNRDASGAALHFNEPTIANGKVYIGTQTALVVYGLLPQ